MPYDKERARSIYAQKLRDPRWQKMRLKIMERDGFTCQDCSSPTITLNVHHYWYENGKEPWEADPESLVTLCEQCHEHETEFGKEMEVQLIRTLRKRHATWIQLDMLAGLLKAKEDLDLVVELLDSTGQKDLLRAFQNKQYAEYRRLVEESLINAKDGK